MDFLSCMNAAIFVAQNDNIRRIEKLSMQFGRLSFAQTRLLALVTDNESPSKVSELARCTEQNPSIISKVSEELVQRGFLERLFMPNDRRTVLLKATDEGVAFWREVSNKIVDEIVRTAVNNTRRLNEQSRTFSDAELHRLQENTIAVYSNLSEAIESFSLRQRRLKTILANVMSVNAFYLLLAVATNSEPMSVANLAKYLGIDKSSVSASVSELTTSGYIEALRSDQDRRKVIITLTEQGERLVKKCDTIFAELFDVGQHFDEEIIRLLFKLSNVGCLNRCC